MANTNDITLCTRTSQANATTIPSTRRRIDPAGGHAVDDHRGRLCLVNGKREIIPIGDGDQHGEIFLASIHTKHVYVELPPFLPEVHPICRLNNNSPLTQDEQLLQLTQGNSSIPTVEPVSKEEAHRYERSRRTLVRIGGIYRNLVMKEQPERMAVQ